MGLFQQLEGAAAVLVENGVYKQVDVFTRNGYIYAKMAGGFVRINADGSTTKDRMRLDTLDVVSMEGALGVDPLGRLCDLAVVPGSKPLPQEVTTKLLGA